MPLAFSSKAVTWESKSVKYFGAGAWLQWSTIYSFVIHGWKCLVHSSHPLPEGLYSTDSYVIHTLLCKVEGKEETSLGASHACGRCEVLSSLWQGHNSEAKVKEIDSAARRNSTTLKCEGQKREVHLGNYLILYRAGKLSALCTSPITICCL